YITEYAQNNGDIILNVTKSAGVEPFSSLCQPVSCLWKTVPVCQRATVPVIQHSSTPVCQYTSAPVRQCPSTPVNQCSSAPMLQYTSAPVHQCSSAPVLQYTSAPVHQCSSTPVLRCSSAPVLHYVSVLETFNLTMMMLVHDWIQNCPIHQLSKYTAECIREGISRGGYPPGLPEQIPLFQMLIFLNETVKLEFGYSIIQSAAGVEEGQSPHMHFSGELKGVEKKGRQGFSV
ncbi:hypothetical protein STEG23_029637, partial [Scotinomys teguina]